MSEPKIYVLRASSPESEPNRIRRREISEMLGLCRGIIADGVIVPDEVQLLKNWLASHPQAASAFPGSTVAARLHRIYADGVVTDEERNDLLALLQDATGQKMLEAVTAPTTLPLDAPPPQVVFSGLTFCFTGKFASGLRSWCENETVGRGGLCLPGVKGSVPQNSILGLDGDRKEREVCGIKGSAIRALIKRKKTLLSDFLNRFY